MIKKGYFKKNLWIFLLLLLLFQCDGNDDETALDSDLFDHKWMRSHEEDPNDSVNVFRPKSYHFPESPGRIGFQFYKSGDMIYYDIAPGKGQFPVSGKWKYNQKEGTLSVNIGKSGKSAFSIKILKVNDEILKVKRVDKRAAYKKKVK